MTETYEVDRETLMEWWGALHEGRRTLQFYRSKGETLEKMENVDEEMWEILEE